MDEGADHPLDQVGKEGVVIAALFVATDGVYFELDDVDPWDEARDARLYAGPHPVVAHPPCERWGRYWGGGPSLHGSPRQKRLGDDGGCFRAALEAVRRWGGVLEHPEASHAFRVFGLGRPKWRQGWVPSADGIGQICCVSQGLYGHRARKMTWLYSVGCELPELDWNVPKPGALARLDQGHHSREERAELTGTDLTRARESSRLKPGENSATPIPFRDVLLAMVRSVQRGET
jgi:hypothetical protein